MIIYIYIHILDYIGNIVGFLNSGILKSPWVYQFEWSFFRYHYFGKPQIGDSNVSYEIVRSDTTTN